MYSDSVPENDQLFPDDVRKDGQKYLVDKEIPHEIQVFPGVPHGQYPLVQNFLICPDFVQALPSLGNMMMPPLKMRRKLLLNRCYRGSNPTSEQKLNERRGLIL